MSIESKISSILSPVGEALTSAVGSAVSAVASTASKLQEEVSQALFGESNSESTNLDTFVSSAAASTCQAAEVDEEIEENKNAQSKNEENLDNTKTNISSVQQELASAQAELNNLQQLQSSANSNSEDGEKTDYSKQIAAAEQKVAQLQTELKSLEENEATLEETAVQLDEQENQLVEQSASLESDAEGQASNGGNIESKAEGTTEKAHEEAAAEVIEQIEIEECAASTAEAAESQPVEAAAVEAPVVAPAAVEEIAFMSETEIPVADNAIAETEIPAETAPQAVLEPTNSSSNAMTRIKNNEQTDNEMATVIVNDMFDLALDITEDDIIGMDAKDAINTASESYKTQVYSESVYKNSISTKTDTATVEENSEAVSEFMAAYAQASEKVNAPGVEFLSLTDKSNFENASKMAARLADSEYILTREIEKQERSIEGIEVSVEETENTEEETSKIRGEELLSKLEDIISNNKDVEENMYDDILTQREYDDMENFFNNSDDYAGTYEQMSDDAEKYGIYAQTLAA